MSESETHSPPKVLLVEDQESAAHLFEMWLSEHYEVEVAYDGFEALDKLDEDIDVVLLDRRMPGMSGDEVLEEIREQGYDCKVSMVSAVEPETDIANLPIDEYLTKPVDANRLRKAVDELNLRGKTTEAKQEVLALLSRKRAIEKKSTPVELKRNYVYQQLTEEIEALLERLNAETTTQKRKYRPDNCPDCGLRWDVSVDDVIGVHALGTRVWKCARCGETVRQPDPTNRGVARR